jgi:hypothetical protein
MLTSILIACSPTNITNDKVMIDWVDFVIFNDIHYQRSRYDDNKLLDNNIEELYGEVKFNVANHIKDINYKIKNGDSAYLARGTKFYRIKGYKPEFRIAVKIDGGWRIYEADTNPKAKKGEDLLDIHNKVIYIGINSETDGVTELGAIKEKSNIEKLVNMILNAEVNQSSQDHDGQRYFIAFHLMDGSNITRCYWIDSGELSRGILLPNEFGVEIKKALSSKD